MFTIPGLLRNLFPTLIPERNPAAVFFDRSTLYFAYRKKCGTDVVRGE